MPPESKPAPPPNPFSEDVVALARQLRETNSTLVWRVTLRRCPGELPWRAEGDVRTGNPFTGLGASPKEALAVLAKAFTFRA